MTATNHKPTHKRGNIADVARTLLHFRHRYEHWWEIGEIILIALVFFLYFLHYESSSHKVGMISHIIVAVLLTIKILVLVAHRFAMKWIDIHGLEN